MMTDTYDDSEYRARQAEKAAKLKRAADAESEARLRAVVAADLANQRSNPALRDRYVPHQWTEAEEAEFVNRAFGSEAERIARMTGDREN